MVYYLYLADVFLMWQFGALKDSWNLNGYQLPPVAYLYQLALPSLLSCANKGSAQMPYGQSTIVVLNLDLYFHSLFYSLLFFLQGMPGGGGVLPHCLLSLSVWLITLQDCSFWIPFLIFNTCYLPVLYRGCKSIRALLSFGPVNGAVTFLSYI